MSDQVSDQIERAVVRLGWCWTVQDLIDHLALYKAISPPITHVRVQANTIHYPIPERIGGVEIHVVEEGIDPYTAVFYS